MSDEREERGPEPIPLPSGPQEQQPIQGQPSGQPFPTRLPTPLILETQRQQVFEQLENARKQAKQSLIQQIEVERTGSSLLVYYSRNLLDDSEVNWLYQLFAGVDKVEKIDLFLFSPGGIATDAYKMGRLIREHCNNLGILVPYKAKSAATLLALAGDEIIMGPASELGPIDPQIPVDIGDGRVQYVPALSIKEGLDFFEKRVKADPETFPLYYRITNELSPLVVGSYVRAIQSAKQYAEDFLSTYMLKNDLARAKDASEKLTEKYLSHGYVIDRRLAREDIGLNVIDAPASVWENMWNLHCYYNLMFQENPKLGSIIQSRNFEFTIGTNLP